MALVWTVKTFSGWGDGRSLGLPLPLLVVEMTGQGDPWTFACPLQQTVAVGEAFFKGCQCKKALSILPELSQPWFLGTGCLTRIAAWPASRGPGSPTPSPALCLTPGCPAAP